MKRKDDGSDSEVLAGSEGQQPWGNFHLATVVFRRALQLRAWTWAPCRAAFPEVRAGAIPEVGRDVRMKEVGRARALSSGLVPGAAARGSRARSA